MTSRGYKLLVNVVLLFNLSPLEVQYRAKMFESRIKLVNSINSIMLKSFDL